MLPLVEINLYTRDALPFQWHKDCVTDEEDDDEKIRKSLVRKKLLLRKREDTYNPIRHCLRYRWVCGS